jgi:hypothetical protein
VSVSRVELPKLALTRHEASTLRYGPDLYQFQGSGPQPRRPISAVQTNVQDMSTTRHPLRYRRFRESAPGKGHYPASLQTSRPGHRGHRRRNQLSSLDESGPFSVSLGHLCVCLSYAVEPPRTPSMAKRKLGPPCLRKPERAILIQSGPPQLRGNLMAHDR